MDYHEFLVQGSASEPYVVTFRRDGANITALCTCRAGFYGQSCKHRLGILSGNTKGIVSDNSDAVAEIVSWLSGTDLESALQNLVEADDEYRRAKKQLSAAKERVAAAMKD